MSYPFSKESEEQLETCAVDLIRLYTAVSEHYNCKILEGKRGQEKQDQYFAQGLSKVKYPNSKHNAEPFSQAVDAGPYPIEWPNGKILSKLTPEQKKEVRKLVRWYHFGGYVKGVADQMGIKIRQGYDWDGDNDFTDQTFNDLPHTELLEG